MGKRYHFFFLVPVILLMAAGILTATTKRAVPVASCMTEDYSGAFREGEKLAIYQGKEMAAPTVAAASDEEPVLGLAVPSERWIEVDLSDQKLKAWDGDSLFLETDVSSGLPWYPTPTGEFRIWVKLRYTKMEGGQGKYYYYLPNVPFTMFFENEDIPGWRGYGLHGTYWHNDFGTPRSHGCVNLRTSDAEKLYYWVGPALPEGKGSVFANPDNPGTRIVIHD